jgi:iron complex outermembrane receptor protein
MIAAVPAASSGQTARDLRGLSLEELMRLNTTTMSRTPQARDVTPASVYVITDEDIGRSGAVSLPQLLRRVPGLHAARIDGSRWAMGIRGFTGRLARAMLVMIDGRPVYSPLFAGTYWEVQDVLLEDIERIEVVRGPGGSLWGANAVTGIINIIRKSAAETRGELVTAAVGNETPGLIGARYGGGDGTAFNYRLSGRFMAHDAAFHADGADFDSGTMADGGFRVDWSEGPHDVTLQGDLYRTVIGQRDAVSTYVPPSRVVVESDDPLAGGNLLARWEHRGASGRTSRLQAYFDRTTRDETAFDERRNTGEIDFQSWERLGVRHELVWGAGYRVTAGTANTAGTLRFFPPERTDHLLTGFIQDDFALVPQRLRVIGGVKLEHNGYSGLEAQPGVRLLWTPRDRHALSASVIRSVRTPSRVEHDFSTGNLLDPGGPLFVRLDPNPDFAPEKLVAYEAGYYGRPFEELVTSVAVFYNRHDDVLSTEVFDQIVDPAIDATVIPVKLGNGLHGSSYGFEVDADAQVTPWSRVRAAYSWLRVALQPRPMSTDTAAEAINEGSSPRHQAQLQAMIDLPGNWEADWFLRYVSALPSPGVDAYATSDLRVAWQMTPELEWFAVGRNLHHDHRLEFVTDAFAVTEIERAVLFGLRWMR